MSLTVEWGQSLIMSTPARNGSVHSKGLYHRFMCWMLGKSDCSKVYTCDVVFFQNEDVNPVPSCMAGKGGNTQTRAIQNMETFELNTAVREQ